MSGDGGRREKSNLNRVKVRGEAEGFGSGAVGQGRQKQSQWNQNLVNLFNLCFTFAFVFTNRTCLSFWEPVMA